MKKSRQKAVVKRGGLYWPSRELKKQANVKHRVVYRRAKKDPLKFWAEQAKGIKWQKKWEKVFEHNPPYFKWFLGGRLNITESCLDEHLKAQRNKIALIWEPEPVGEAPRIFTYEQLYREVNRFANALKQLGVRKGDRVGIYLPMLPEAVISMLACARLGAVHCVVFSAFSPQALRIRLEDTEAKVLITADGYYRRGQVIDLKKAADLGINETEVKKVVVVKRAGNKISMEQGRDYYFHELIRGQSDFCEPEIMNSEDLLFILYTSGSTGKPKGVMHTAGGYAVQAKSTGKWIFDFKEDDVFWSMADLGWITGHSYSCYSPLLNGTIFVLYEGAPDWPAPDRWAQIIEKYGVTIFYTAPTAIRMFEKYGTDLIKKYKFETLRLLASVGEPIDEAAWHWYFKEVGRERCPLVDTWWQTETGGILITSLPGLGPFKPAHTGLPLPGLRFELFSDEGRRVRRGREGNLVLLPPFSPGLLRGIYKNPEKYLETYWSQYGPKVYFTSDSARQDSRGLVRIVGRVDDVIKVAGHRFTTGEFENVIAKLPEVVEAAVIGKKDEIKGEVPVAFAVVKDGSKRTNQIKEAVVQIVRKEIGPIAMLKDVYLVDDLPKTRSGKIMRRILKRLFTGEELGDLSTLANPQSVEAIRRKISD